MEGNAEKLHRRIEISSGSESEIFDIHFQNSKQEEIAFFYQEFENKKLKVEKGRFLMSSSIYFLLF